MVRSFFLACYDIVKKAVLGFIEDDIMTKAGALAFFAIFSIPPIIIIILNGVAIFAGQEIAAQKVYEQIQLLGGSQLASRVQNLINSYSVEFQDQQTTLYSILSICIFLISSTSFFLYIQFTLNRIWDIKPKPKSTLLGNIKNRGFSIVLIIVLIVLILASVILDFSLILLQYWLVIFFPLGNQMSSSFVFLGGLLSFLFVILILAIIFKYLADVSISWNVVWVGAMVTSFLFEVGKLVVGFVLSISNITSTYGLAGSLIIVLLWVYYSAIILFFGAEVTQQYAIFRSDSIQPNTNAVKIVSKEISLNG